MNSVFAFLSQLPRLLQRAMYSLLAFLPAAFLGSLLLLFGSMDPGTSRSRMISEIPTGALITFIFATPIWFLVMLPLSMAIRATSAVCSALVAPLFGAACGAGAALMEVTMLCNSFGESQSEVTRFYVYGAAVGACAWSAFAWMLRSSELVATQDTR